MMYALIAYIGNDVMWLGRYTYAECLDRALLASWRAGIEFNCMMVM